MRFLVIRGKSSIMVRIVRKCDTYGIRPKKNNESKRKLNKKIGFKTEEKRITHCTKKTGNVC